jgi:hypothetical protein
MCLSIVGIVGAGILVVFMLAGKVRKHTFLLASLMNVSVFNTF